MKKVIVNIPNIFTSVFEVEANDKEEAMVFADQLLRQTIDDNKDMKYHYQGTLKQDLWLIEEKESSDNKL